MAPGPVRGGGGGAPLLLMAMCRKEPLIFYQLWDVQGGQVMMRGADNPWGMSLTPAYTGETEEMKGIGCT